MSEPLFNKVVGLKTTKRETPTQLFSYEYWETLKSTNFEEHLQTTFRL